MNEGEQCSTKLDSPKKAAFLAAYAECASITEAAKIAGISRDAHYKWMKSDSDYPNAFAVAHEQSIESLERAARRRAIKGWREPVFYEGVICGYKRRYSDTMLAMLLNGNRPEKYRNRVEHTGPNGGAVQVDHRIQQLRETLESARGDVNYARVERERAIEDSSIARLNGHGGQRGPMANGTPSCPS